MAFGGGGGADDAFLIGPILEWWDKHTTKRDAGRTAKAEAKAGLRRQPPVDGDHEGSITDPPST